LSFFILLRQNGPRLFFLGTSMQELDDFARLF
jgi:hypothetical protein